MPVCTKVPLEYAYYYNVTLYRTLPQHTNRQAFFRLLKEGKTLKDYITEYQVNAKNDQIHRFAVAVGVDEEKLRAIMAIHATESTINEYGRFDALKASVDMKIAKQYFEAVEGKPLPFFKITIKLDELLRKFIFADGFEV